MSDKIREEFEKERPLPEHMYWDDDERNYCNGTWGSPTADQRRICGEYLHDWEMWRSAWKAALAHQPESEPDDSVIERIRQWHWEKRGCQLCPEDYRNIFEIVRLYTSPQPSAQPESEPKGTVGNCYGPDNRGLYRIAVFSGSHFPVGTTVCASPQPSAQVPEDLLPRVKNLLHDVGEWGIREAQELYTQLSAAPSIAEKPDEN